MQVRRRGDGRVTVLHVFFVLRAPAVQAACWLVAVAAQHTQVQSLAPHCDSASLCCKTCAQVNPLMGNIRLRTKSLIGVADELLVHYRGGVGKSNEKGGGGPVGSRKGGFEGGCIFKPKSGIHFTFC